MRRESCPSILRGAPLLALVAACTASPAPQDLPEPEQLEPRWGSITPRDAGDASFVRQAVPLLLGRKVKGDDELRLLVDLIGHIGRRRVVWALTRQDESIQHWSEVWMDLLRVNRIGQKAQPGCYGPGLHASDDGSLGRILRDRDPVTGQVVGIGTVNMTDVVRSSLEADDVTPIYRAHLFPLLEHNIVGANEVTEANLRLEAAQTFNSAYLNRNKTCLGCHGGATGPATGWNRTFMLPGDAERFLHYNNTELAAFFRSEQRNGNIHPFGLHTSCGTYHDPDNIPPDAVEGSARLGFDYGEDGTVWDLEDQLHTGIDQYRRFGLTFLGGIPMVQQDRSTAYLVSANIIDGVWTRVMGSPLTLPHSRSRNEGQRDLHFHLLNHHFVRRNFSPAYLLTGILTSPYFNRVAPLAGQGADPYEMPMVFDPWVAADPREDPNPPAEGLHNAMTEAIHRYSARTLLYSTHAAMGWTAPPVFPGVGYPDVELSRSLGQYLKEAEPGGNGTDFQGLLHWDTEVGRGQKPIGFAGNDWIDRVMIDSIPFDAANPGAPLTLHDLAQTVRDWVLGDGTLTPSETGLLEDLFAQPLSTTAASLSAPVLETKLRALAGVYLESPQFMLAGIAPTAVGPNPRLRVCNDAPCTYEQLCEALRPQIEGQRYEVTCNPDSVVVNPQVNALNPYGFADLLCAKGPCIFEDLGVYAECVQEPWLCPRVPPICDPRCVGGFECCGNSTLGDDPWGMFLLWGEGGIVEEAGGIRILPTGASEYEELEDGRMLEAGDLLVLDPGSNLRVGLEQGPWGTPEEGVPENPEMGSWLVMVTGPSAVQGGIESPELPHEIDWDVVTDNPDYPWGEGGQPGEPFP